MPFIKFADATSLRDITNGLCGAIGNLNHLGLTKATSKSGLCYINEHRSIKLLVVLLQDDTWRRVGYVKKKEWAGKRDQP